MIIPISVVVSIIHNYLVADLHDKNPSFSFYIQNEKIHLMGKCCFFQENSDRILVHDNVLKIVLDLIFLKGATTNYNKRLTTMVDPD